MLSRIILHSRCISRKLTAVARSRFAGQTCRASITPHIQGIAREIVMAYYLATSLGIRVAYVLSA